MSTLGMSILTLSASLALTASVSLAGPATATFEGAPDSPEGYPGSAGNGWQDGWSIAQTQDANAGVASKGAAMLAATSPLVEGGNQYLTFTNDVPSQAALARQLATADSTFTSPFTVSFDLRIESQSTAGLAVVIASSMYANPGASSSHSAFMIYTNRVGSVQHWFIVQGDHNGKVATNVDTGLVAGVGQTFRFVIDIDPTASTYDVSINGVDFDVDAATERFTFRCDAASAVKQSWLNFKAISGSGGAPQSFSLDNVAVSPGRP